MSTHEREVESRFLVDDETLAAATARGDGNSLGVLYERHSSMVKRALRRSAPEMPLDEAEDLTQDVFMLFWKKAAIYENRMKCKAYLYGIAVKKATAWRRRTWLRRKLLAREFSARTVLDIAPGAGASERLEVKQTVRLALEKLPEKQRTVLLMYTVEGFSGDEIAAILKIPAETVRTRLCRARQTLIEDVQENRRRPALRKEKV